MISTRTASAILAATVTVISLLAIRHSRRKRLSKTAENDAENESSVVGTAGFRRLISSDLDIKSAYDQVLLPVIQKYGYAKFWFGSYAYVFSDPEVTRYMLTHIDEYPKNQKPPNPNSLAAVFFGKEHIVNANGMAWRRLRRILSPPFRKPFSSETFSTMTQEMIDQWNQSMQGEGKVTVKVHSWMQRLTLDVLGRALLGFDFKAISDHPSPAVALYHSVFGGKPPSYIYFLFPFLDRWYNPFRYRAWRDMYALKDTFIKIIRERKREFAEAGGSLEENRKNMDLLSLMVQAASIEDEEMSQDEEGLTEEEILANFNILYLAGHDTTATSLVAEIFYLAKYPEYQQKLLDELNTAIPDPNQVPLMTDKLPLMDAFIRESMRISPAVGYLVPRTVEKEMTVNLPNSSESKQMTLPKGSRIFISIIGLHYNSKIFADPDVFRPERFLKHAETDEMNRFFGFGGGSRICLGMNFSLQEQRIVLSMLLRNFTWAFPEGTTPPEKLIMHGFVLSRPDEIEIQFMKR